MFKLILNDTKYPIVITDVSPDEHVAENEVLVETLPSFTLEDDQIALLVYENGTISYEIKDRQEFFSNYRRAS